MTKNKLPYEMFFEIVFSEEKKQEVMDLWKFLASYLGDNSLDEEDHARLFGHMSKDSDDEKNKNISFYSSVVDHYTYCYNALRRGDIISFTVQNSKYLIARSLLSTTP